MSVWSLVHQSNTSASLVSNVRCPSATALAITQADGNFDAEASRNVSFRRTVAFSYLAKTEHKSIGTLLTS